MFWNKKKKKAIEKHYSKLLVFTADGMKRTWLATYFTNDRHMPKDEKQSSIIIAWGKKEAEEIFEMNFKSSTLIEIDLLNE